MALSSSSSKTLLQVLHCSLGDIHDISNSWPQHIDDLLDDMGLPYFRSGGSWLTWPFKVMDLREIFSLGLERKAKRAALWDD